MSNKQEILSQKTKSPQRKQPRGLPHNWLSTQIYQRLQNLVVTTPALCAILGICKCYRTS